MVKAMKAKVGNPLRKLVLIKLADNANDSGECWPSYQHIADQCEISRTTVKVHIRELEKAGFLRREFRRNGELNQSNIFHLSLEGGAVAALPGAADALGGGAADAPRTSHSLEPVKEPDAPSAPKRTKVTFTEEGFTIHDCDLLNAWQEAYGKQHVENELAKAKAWVIATKSKKKDWARFLTNWMANSKADSLDEAGCPVDQIIDLYHKVCPNLPRVTVTTDKVLRGLIVERWRESVDHQSGKDFWLPFFTKANNRNQVFYRGANVEPRLEALVSRAIFREISEAKQ